MKDTKEAHKEEIKIAVGKNHVDPDGIPYITVVLDGGWSKRSYGHNYSALSGVVSIIIHNYPFNGILNSRWIILGLFFNPLISLSKLFPLFLV